MTSNYWTSGTRRIGRRQLIRGTAAGGLGLAAAALIGCGDDEETGGGTATEAPSGGTTAPAPTQTMAPETPAGKPQGGTLRIREIGDPPDWSMLKASNASARFSYPAYSKLLDVKTGPGVSNTDVIPQPDLAVAMPEVTPDGMELTFTIHEGVNFQDVAPVNGRPLLAEDVKFAIDTYLETGSFARDFAAIDHVETIDDTTITVTMKQPHAPLINLSAGHYGWRIFPRELMENDLHKNIAIGSGPWIVDSYEEGNKAVYRRNPDYFKGPDALYLDQMEFVIIPTNPTAGAAFRSGEIDILYAALACVEANELAEQVKDTAKITYDPGNSAWFAFNTLKPPFEDIRVRQAIALAYNREAESQAIFCGDAIVTGVLPMADALDPQDMNTFPESAKWLRYAPDEAKKLLAAAGYPDGFDTTAVFTPRYGQIYQFSLERVIGDLQLVGINVEPISYEYGEWISDIYRGDYAFDGFLWGPGRNYPDAEPYVAYWLHPDGIANQSRVNDPTMTALIEKQRTQMNPEDRWETLRDIQRLEAENMWYVWRTAGIGTNFAQGWVEDYWDHNGYDGGEYHHIWDNRLA